MGTTGLIFILLILLIPLAATIYILYDRRRAQRAGLPPLSLSSYNPFTKRIRPSQNYPAPSGFIGWVYSKVHSFSSSHGEASYEEAPGRRGRRGLDADEAWDARVGNEPDGYGTSGYYEEQELDLQPSLGGAAYARGGYGGSHGQTAPDHESDEPQRGRSLGRGGQSHIDGREQVLDRRYDEAMARDDAERSDLRATSPRSMKDNRGHKKKESGDSATERRSIFREDV